MPIDFPFLKALTEAPSVGTACGPVLSVVRDRFGDRFDSVFVPDGFCLFQCAGAAAADLKLVFVAHLDEIGGVVLGPAADAGEHAFFVRSWGNRPEVFAASPLQAFDYLADSPDAGWNVESQLRSGAEMPLLLHSERLRPYRTAWTFREETILHDAMIEGKALDPRVTLYAAIEVVRALAHPAVGAVFVMAEECAMDVAQKAVSYLSRHAPALEMVVNADVPDLANLSEGRLDLPAIRIFEGNRFVDPCFGMRAAELLTARSVAFHLTASRSGSQTSLFTPLGRTLSVALPSDGVHLPRVRMSQVGLERCTTLLEAIGEAFLEGALDWPAQRR